MRWYDPQSYIGKARWHSLERDYVLYVYPAKGINWKGSVPKVRRLTEMVYKAGPANLILTTLRRNMYSGITPEEVVESITQEGTRVFCVFDGREKITEALRRIKEADEGISIVVSGVIDRVREISAEIGIDPHTINLSLGIRGRTDRLPPADIREFTTMCGHGLVSPHLVRDIIRRVRTGKDRRVGRRASFWRSPVPAAFSTPSAPWSCSGKRRRSTRWTAGSGRESGAIFRREVTAEYHDDAFFRESIRRLYGS